MAKRQSAGILLYRVKEGNLEVFLVHPGGPLWAKKDEGAWSIPKGEFAEDEAPAAAARREFEEETGTAFNGSLTPLKSLQLKSGKWVHAWAGQGDIDAATITSNTFLLEWPPRSGRRQEFPEVDRAGWFSVEAARAKINPAQAALLDQLVALLA